MGRPKKAPKGPASLYDKVKAFDEDLAVTVNTMTTEDLKGKLTQLAKSDDDQEVAREGDTDLTLLRGQLKTATDTYAIPLKENKLRRRLVLQTLKERGQL